MALASQSGRPVSRRYMYRRRRRRSGRWLALLAVVAVVVLIVWGVWPSPKTTLATESSETEATPRIEPTADPVESPNTRTSTAATSNNRTSSARLNTTTPEPTPSTSAEPVSTKPELTTTAANTSENSSPTIPVNPQPAEPKQPAVTTTTPTTSTTSPITDAMTLSETDPLTARLLLTDLVASGALNTADAERAREKLTALGEALLFDPSLLTGDNFARHHVVQPGDSLARIANRGDIQVEWAMLKRINRINNPSMIRVGQRLKVPNGTFHAVVSKSDYVLDLYLANDKGRIIVASYPVGLGEFNGTPTGRFKVRTHSKLENPQWRNPRTGEFFLPDDPMNPIGERWIGMEGVDSNNKDLTGYGIHGTIDPDSIGQNRSMGCIRLLDPHVRVIYEALVEPESTIEIKP